MSEAKTEAEADLGDLARMINIEHAQAERSARDAVAHALVAGDLLIAAKSQVAHGEWLPWLNANCTVGERMAQNEIGEVLGVTEATVNRDIATVTNVTDAQDETIENKELGAPSVPIGTPLDAVAALAADEGIQTAVERRRQPSR